MKLTEKAKTKLKRSMFYYGMLLFPLAMFCLFYIYTNIDSIYMAFSNFSYETGKFEFVGFDVFETIFYNFGLYNYFWDSTWRSVILVCARIFILIPMAFIFSYYLYKKLFGHKVLKVLMFLPTMVSSIVMVTVFRYFMEYALPEIGTVFGVFIPNDLLSNVSTAFPVVLTYYVWMSLGSQIMLYTGAMSAISDSVIEAGALDGASHIKEMLFIVFPSVWGTIVTFIVVGVAGTFTDMMCLYDFYGNGASNDIMTIGYYLYRQINSPSVTYAQYPELSGLGLLYTLVSLPIVLTLRYLLVRFGPKED